MIGVSLLSFCLCVCGVEHLQHVVVIISGRLNLYVKEN